MSECVHSAAGWTRSCDRSAVRQICDGLEPEGVLWIADLRTASAKGQLRRARGFRSPRRRGRRTRRSKACSRNETKHDLSKAKLQKPVNSPAAEVAAAVRTLAIMLDPRRWNDGPKTVAADFAGNPIAVFNPGFCRRTILAAATRHCSIIWHHPGGIEPLMDGMVLRRMLMLLRYG